MSFRLTRRLFFLDACVLDAWDVKSGPLILNVHKAGGLPRTRIYPGAASRAASFAVTDFECDANMLIDSILRGRKYKFYRTYLVPFRQSFFPAPLAARRRADI